MITIVDYGLGNIRAFVNSYGRLNIPVRIVTKADDLLSAEKIILPGVGAFDDAMKRLGESGMRPALEACVLGRGIPLLGVCVGMQMLARSSEEGHLPGLGWIDGEVKRFSPGPPECPLRVPHMGWNSAKTLKSDGLFDGLERGARFYFLHSYYFEAHKPEDVLAVAEYGGEVACAVRSGNVYGVQFHPEKSHRWGIRLLENFAKLPA